MNGVTRLCGCNLTAQSCGSLSLVLQSSNSVLRELDLSNNDLKHSGVKLLTDGLKSPNCQLEILRLCGCNLTAQSCESLSSALQSSNSNILRELDLSNNDLQDSGVKLLSDGLKSLKCQLEILRLSGCMVTEKGCRDVSSVLSLNTSHLRELDLSYNHPGDSGVKLLTEKLLYSTCSLDKLKYVYQEDFRLFYFSPSVTMCYIYIYLSVENNSQCSTQRSDPIIIWNDMKKQKTETIQLNCDNASKVLQETSCKTTGKVWKSNQVYGAIKLHQTRVIIF
ncbi:ribonuclease inhibitor-like [Labeo rohita]|uniref:ribonuclease inhibitor-like n=1 Tax=Labeo rohita TaxID=84645 RepID=UPI0021E1FB5A|nr:ribonuclease inhibitor-like [Labeo rohita]